MKQPEINIDESGKVERVFYFENRQRETIEKGIFKEGVLNGKGERKHNFMIDGRKISSRLERGEFSEGVMVQGEKIFYNEKEL